MIGTLSSIDDTLNLYSKVLVIVPLNAIAVTTAETTAKALGQLSSSNNGKGTLLQKKLSY